LSSLHSLRYLRIVGRHGESVRRAQAGTTKDAEEKRLLLEDFFEKISSLSLFTFCWDDSNCNLFSMTFRRSQAAAPGHAASAICYTIDESAHALLGCLGIQGVQEARARKPSH
jgi:hypothetical protein